MVRNGKGFIYSRKATHIDECTVIPDSFERLGFPYSRPSWRTCMRGLRATRQALSSFQPCTPLQMPAFVMQT